MPDKGHDELVNGRLTWGSPHAQAGNLQATRIEPCPASRAGGVGRNSHRLRCAAAPRPCGAEHTGARGAALGRRPHRKVLSQSQRASGRDQISLPGSDFVPKSLPLNSEGLRLNCDTPLSGTSGTRFRSPRATSYTESLPVNSRTVNSRVQSQRLIDMLKVGGSIPSPPTNPLLQFNYSAFYARLHPAYRKSTCSMQVL